MSSPFKTKSAIDKASDFSPLMPPEAPRPKSASLGGLSSMTKSSLISMSAGSVSSQSPAPAASQSAPAKRPSVPDETTTRQKSLSLSELARIELRSQSAGAASSPAPASAPSSESLISIDLSEKDSSMDLLQALSMSPTHHQAADSQTKQS